MLRCVALRCVALRCVALRCVMLCYVVLCCTVLYCTVLSCTVLYYTRLNYNVLTVLCCNELGGDLNELISIIADQVKMSSRGQELWEADPNGKSVTNALSVRLFFF